MDSERTSLEDLIAKLGTFELEPDSAVLILKLKKAFPESDPALLALAVETFVSRHIAREKLGEWATEGFFSTSLLQQASRTAIADYRARAFRGLSHVLEIGTGTGSDTAALAAVCAHVTTIDNSPISTELARRNLTVRGVTNVSFLLGDIGSLHSVLPSDIDGLFADPARRRPDGVRVKDANDYSPPLSDLLELEIGTVRAIKISPGLFIDPPPGWSREFIGYDEECLEQTLWYGTNFKDSSVFVADRGAGWARSVDRNECESASSLQGFLVEPHAVVNRSKHVPDFFAELGIRIIDRDVAYGVTGICPEPNALYSRFRILRAIPYRLKSLKTALRELTWSSRTELKKRNFADDIEQIRKDLALPPHSHSSPYGVVFLFRWQGKPWCVLAERVS